MRPPAPGDVVLRTTGGISVPAGGRFLRVAFDGAGLQCPNPAPLLGLTVEESGVERDPWSGHVELCTDGRSQDVGAAPFGRVRVGSYESEQALRVTASTVDLVLRDFDPGTPGHFNDGGVDELRLLDVTPALTLEFAATPVTTGETTILRFVVTNSTDGLAKDGWGFDDTLPAGLAVAGAPTTTCPGAVLAAPVGASTVTVTGGRLDAGQTTALTWTAFMAFVMPQSRYWLDVGDHVARWIAVAAVAMLAGVAVVLLLDRRDVRARAAQA